MLSSPSPSSSLLASMDDERIVEQSAGRGGGVGRGVRKVTKRRTRQTRENKLWRGVSKMKSRLAVTRSSDERQNSMGVQTKSNAGCYSGRLEGVLVS